jgi:hypothetical protein
VIIGENSIIGAGSMVTSDIPANVIAAGNPARVVKELDPSQKLTRREDMLADGPKLAMQMDGLERWMRTDNTWLKWFQALIAPTKKD